MPSGFKDATDERNWVRVFDNWCDENGLEKNPKMVRPEQLDIVLERFFACVRKHK